MRIAIRHTTRYRFDQPPAHGLQRLRLRPKSATIAEDEIEAILNERKEARQDKDFARSDALRDDLANRGVEVMDGDPLGWEWKLA